MNLSFMNFYVLAKEICRRSGIEVGQIIQQPVIYEGIIAELLKQHLSTNPIFKNVPSPTTLASALFQVIQDLTDANVHADDLKEAVREGFVEGMEVQKLQGVIQLYDLFRQRLKSTNISHYSDIYRMVTSYITDSEFLRRFKYILAYGFYDLTGVEQDFFGEIFRAYPTILFLPYQKKHPGFAYVKPFFESFVLGMARDIEELCPDVSTGFSYLMDSTSEGTPVVSCQPLVTDQKVDTHFITHNEKCETRNQKLVIINVSGRHDEVWTVAKEILKLTDAGYAMETIGVVARSLEPYTDTIKKNIPGKQHPICHQHTGAHGKVSPDKSHPKYSFAETGRFLPSDGHGVIWITLFQNTVVRLHGTYSASGSLGCPEQKIRYSQRYRVLVSKA